GGAELVLNLKGRVEKHLKDIAAGSIRCPAHRDVICSSGRGRNGLEKRLLIWGRCRGASDHRIAGIAELDGGLQPGRTRSNKHSDRLTGVDSERIAIGVSNTADAAGFAGIINQ